MAIGVFDSGVGGLTVHHRLVERFPKADFIYLADQANAPYGGRSGEEIVALTQAGCIRLFEGGCDVVVLACNTAASVVTGSSQLKGVARTSFQSPSTSARKIESKQPASAFLAISTV